jgi:hypothetical protein
VFKQALKVLPDREKFVTQLPGVPQLPQFLAYMQSHGIKAAASGVQNGAFGSAFRFLRRALFGVERSLLCVSCVMKCFFFCRQQGSQSLMLTDTGQFQTSRSCSALTLSLHLITAAFMPINFGCPASSSHSLAVVDMATGRCETTAKLESPALEAAFRATFGQLLAAMR